MLSYNEIRFDLALLLHRGSIFLEETIVELFGAKVLVEGSGKDEELRTVHIPLPEFWDDAAQCVVDLLIRGFGLTENARLFFHYQDRKEGEDQPGLGKA